jgi:hypothetical protein
MRCFLVASVGQFAVEVGRRDTAIHRELYVRSVNGPQAAWYKGIALGNEGLIRSGGADWDVTFAEAHDQDDAIDVA